MSEWLGCCLWCGAPLNRVLPNGFLSNAIQTNMPEVMAVSCTLVKCEQYMVLVERKEPHGIRGTVRHYVDASGKEHQEIFFADGGELIVPRGEEI